jgi:hypothetical protein
MSSLGKSLLSCSVFIGLIASAPSSHASSTNGVRDFTIHQPYLSVRALGMGNAFTAVADDYNALLYNPAGLARLTAGQINMGFGAGFDDKFLKLQSDIQAASGSGDMQDMIDLLNDNLGKHYSARVPTISGHWVRPRWGLAVIPADVNLELQIRQLGLVSLNAVATQDTTIAYGRGWDVNWSRSSRVSFGVTGKAVYRIFYNATIPATDLALDSQIMRPEDAKEGLAFDADLGMLWSPKNAPTGWKRLTQPTIGAAVRNVVDGGFNTNLHVTGKDSGSDPRKLGRRFDLGGKWDLADFWIFKTQAMADLRDMGHDNWTLQKGSHLGAEFLWKVRGWWQGGWRIGVNQGYFTAGFTGKLAIFSLDLATYGEEVGHSDGPKSSRRYVMRASLDW